MQVERWYARLHIHKERIKWQSKTQIMHKWAQNDMRLMNRLGKCEYEVCLKLVHLKLRSSTSGKPQQCEKYFNDYI